MGDGVTLQASEFSVPPGSYDCPRGVPPLELLGDAILPQRSCVALLLMCSSAVPFALGPAIGGKLAPC